MKNAFKLSFLVLVISISTTACGGKKKPGTSDTTVKVDSIVKIDSTVKKDTTVKVDTVKIDSAKKDTSKKKLPL